MRTVIGAGVISSLLPGRRHTPASLHDAVELLPATAGPRSPRRPGPAGRSRTLGTGIPQVGEVYDAAAQQVLAVHAADGVRGMLSFAAAGSTNAAKTG